MNSRSINYAKFNGASEQSAMRATGWKSGKRMLITAVTSTLLVISVTCLVAGIVTRFNKQKTEGDRQIGDTKHLKPPSKAVQDACSSTFYPELCLSSISSFPGLSDRAGPMEIVHAVVNLSIGAVEKTSTRARTMSTRHAMSHRRRGALQDCVELFEETLEQLYETLSNLKNASCLSAPEKVSELEILLSAAITNQYTCLDSSSGTNVTQILQGGLINISHLVSNSLAILKYIVARNSIHNRRLLSDNEGSEFMVMESDGFPSWMSERERKLLQSSRENIRPNAVVAKDGSGHYRSIADAVNAAPQKSNTRYIIHIKAGVYWENVDVSKKTTHLMFIGDGIGATVVAGNRNVKDGYTTYRSATVAVKGNGFIARDITFENTAGPAKHQAVALRVGADFAAFYRCSFTGYQDTLYVHSLRQFYRECNVYGTVDFIFGNAAVVLQNCNLFARKPLAYQQIVYTAQGRQDPNENTGISIQNCQVVAASDLIPVKNFFPAFLGRPWRQYSRTVFMQSYLGDLIRPAGWVEWNGNFALNTLYYGEFMNRGPGAGTANRVRWPGYRAIRSSMEARRFTVSQFIQGNSWLPSTGIQYFPGFT